MALDLADKEENFEKDITCAKFAHMGKERNHPYEYTAYRTGVKESCADAKKRTNYLVYNIESVPETVVFVHPIVHIVKTL